MKKYTFGVENVDFWAVPTNLGLETGLVGGGGVLCLAPTHLPLGEKDFVIPLTYV